MDPWIVWRFAKFIAVAAFAAGVMGSVWLPGQRDRRFAAHVLATLGLIAVWVAGYGLVKVHGLSIREPWISRSLLAGLGAMAAAAWSAARPTTPRVARGLAVGALLAAFGMMSAREGSVALWLIVPLLGAGASLAPTPRASPGVTDEAGTARTVEWFAWLARAEGVSLLLLFGVYMPLKYGAGIVLDGGQGWFGWVHGVLQLLYIVALVVTARVAGWSVLRTALGFVASLVPFGTFVFERRVRP